MGHNASDTRMVPILESFQHIFHGTCARVRWKCPPQTRRGAAIGALCASGDVTGSPSRCAPVVHALACQDPTH